MLRFASYEQVESPKPVDRALEPDSSAKLSVLPADETPAPPAPEPDSSATPAPVTVPTPAPVTLPEPSVPEAVKREACISPGAEKSC